MKTNTNDSFISVKVGNNNPAKGTNVYDVIDRNFFLIFIMFVVLVVCLTRMVVRLKWGKMEDLEGG